VKLFKRKKHKHHLKLEHPEVLGTMLKFTCTKKKCPDAGTQFAYRRYRVHQLVSGLTRYRESDRVY
jgi:hypothetical protein